MLTCQPLCSHKQVEHAFCSWRSKARKCEVGCIAQGLHDECIQAATGRRCGRPPPMASAPPLRKRAVAGKADEPQCRRRITQTGPARTIAIPSAPEEEPPPEELKLPATEIAIYEPVDDAFAYQLETERDRAAMEADLSELLPAVTPTEEYDLPTLEEATLAEVELVNTQREKGGSTTEWSEHWLGGGSFCFKLVKNGSNKQTVYYRLRDGRVVRSTADLMQEIAVLRGAVRESREDRVEDRLRAFAIFDRLAAQARSQAFLSEMLRARDTKARKASAAEQRALAAGIMRGDAISGLVYRASHSWRVNSLGRPLCYIGLTRGCLIYLDNNDVVWTLSYEWLLEKREKGHRMKARKEQRSICFASHLRVEGACWSFVIVYAYGVTVPEGCLHVVGGVQEIGVPQPLPSPPVMSDWEAVTSSLSNTETALIKAEGGTITDPWLGPTLNISTGGSGVPQSFSTLAQDVNNSLGFAMFMAAWELCHRPVEEGGLDRAPRVNVNDPDIVAGVNLSDMVNKICSHGQYLNGFPERREMLESLTPPFVFSRLDEKADELHAMVVEWIEFMGDDFDGTMPTHHTKGWKKLGLAWMRANSHGQIVKGRPKFKQMLLGLGVAPGLWCKWS